MNVLIQSKWAGGDLIIARREWRSGNNQINDKIYRMCSDSVSHLSIETIIIQFFSSALLASPSDLVLCCVVLCCVVLCCVVLCCVSHRSVAPMPFSFSLCLGVLWFYMWSKPKWSCQNVCVCVCAFSLGAGKGGGESWPQNPIFFFMYIDNCITYIIEAYTPHQAVGIISFLKKNILFAQPPSHYKICSSNVNVCKSLLVFLRD